MKATFLPVLVLALLLGTAANAAAQTGDVTHNTWTSGAPMPTPLVGSAFGVIKGKIYLVSGATTTAIVGNNEIGPAIVVVIGPRRAEAVVPDLIVHSGFYGDFFKRAIATIVVKKIALAFESPGAALYLQSFI